MSYAYSPIARICPSGPTLPATPAEGSWWLHTPTGRRVLALYSGGAWQFLESFGATTVYVDTAAGSDAPDQGGAAGAGAYATLQYAIDRLPGLNGGNVLINVASGIYRELVTIQGKAFSGPYTLTLLGSVSTDYTAAAPSAVANGVGNGSAGFGTIQKLGAGRTANQDQGKLLDITAGTGTGQRFVVHSNTTDTWTLTGRWSPLPDASSTFRVGAPTARITGANAGAETTPVRASVFRILGGQTGVVLDTLRLDYATSEIVRIAAAGSAATVRGCQVLGATTAHGIYVRDYGVATLDTCACGPANNVVMGIAAADFAQITRCRLTGAAAYNLVCGSHTVCFDLEQSYLGQSGLAGLYTNSGALINVQGYVEVEGAGSNGAVADPSSLINTGGLAGAAATNRMLNNTGWGAAAGASGLILGCSGWTYSGNTSGTFTPTTLTGGGTN